MNAELKKTAGASPNMKKSTTRKAPGGTLGKSTEKSLKADSASKPTVIKEDASGDL
jgi:hypothetical protein